MEVKAFPIKVSMPSRAWVVTISAMKESAGKRRVSMPSRAWVVTVVSCSTLIVNPFQCPLGLELLPFLCFPSCGCLFVSMPSRAWVVTVFTTFAVVLIPVSMPSRAWVVTARMSNILNFSWYFLFIPAIYRCILAHLPIFFNQLSKFLRCESPSTFLGTCLSHHSFIIFLVTNTNTLLSGLYIISTYPFKNLGFMRFSEPVFAGIYQNIMTTAVFRAC